MSFKSASPFWAANPKHGRKLIYTDPEELRGDCLEYFQWCEENPLYRYEIKSEDKMLVEVSIPMRRIMTLKGLAIFLGVSPLTLHNYRQVPEFKDVMDFVHSTIHNQKYEGAAAGQFNAALVMRDLGLVEKTMVASDPDNPLPQQVVIFQLPDNGRDPEVEQN